MRIVVDPDRCEGNAACTALLPEIFEVTDPDGPAAVLQGRPPESLRAEVERAAHACPRAAIAVLDD